MINELLNRRGLLMGSGSAIDWESVARGLLDNSLDFTLPEVAEVRTQNNQQLFSREKMSGHATIKSGCTTIGYQSFAYCKLLQGVTIPDTVTSIGQGAFTQCYALTEVEIPSSVTSIAAQAFMSCTGLVEVICERSTPPTLVANSFQGCTALTSIYVPDASVSAYKSASGWSTYASIIKPISQRPT